MSDTMKRDKWNKIFYGCPGAWYGNPIPGDDHIGTITINVKRAVDAIHYLKRKRLSIVETCDAQEPRGLTIKYTEPVKIS